jgi:hypothetical protein
MTRKVPRKKSLHAPIWVIGWREWLSMPDLEIDAIKAKIDTGASSSVLHAINIERFRRGGRDMVRFDVHPHQRDTAGTVLAEAELVDERNVRSSTGHQELRPVVLIGVKIRGRHWITEFTLTGRYEMGFRVLLGRRALRGRFLVDTDRSFVAGQPHSHSRTKAKKVKT